MSQMNVLPDWWSFTFIGLQAVYIVFHITANVLTDDVLGRSSSSHVATSFGPRWNFHASDSLWI
jgi:hypothetical protein